MEREKVKEQVIAFIQELIDGTQEEITEECGLMEDLDISSLEILTLIADLEEKFKIELEETYIRDILTVGDLVESVYNKL